MKVAIDARLYGLEHAGIGRYVMNLVNQLCLIDKDNKYEILLRKSYFDKLELPSKWRKHLVDDRHYSLAEQFSVPQLLNKIKPDVTHFPHFNVPFYYKRKYVVTIHDLSKNRSIGKQSTTLPYPVYLVKRVGYRKILDNAIQSSSKIIVPSEVVRKDIIFNYRIPQEKVVITYEGVTIGNESSDGLRLLSDINKPYFVYTGSAYPHKNLERLIEAIVYLNRRLKEDSLLVISSSRNIFADRLNKMITDKNAGKYVKYEGFLSDDELFGLYKHSAGFVYPSLMEGFGLPGLEAIKAGTIALVSDIPIFKEIYKDNAIYFNPYDFTAIARTMQDVLRTNRSKRRNLIKTAQEYIRRYDWKNMAQETIKVYEQVAK